MPTERACYVYGVIQERKPQTFNMIGLGGPKDRISTIHVKDLAAVVGCPPKGSGVMTRDAAMTHEKVIEEIMKQYAVLPLTFGVVTDARAVRTKLLRDRCDDLRAALARIEGKVELGLKAFWLDMATIFKEVAEALGVTSNGSASYAERIAIGERVAQMVAQKKKQEAEAIIAALRDLAEETVEKEAQSDRMVLDCAFLVHKKREAAFDKAVAQIATANEERIKFKYVLSPPYNFVNLQLTLHER